jgi:hypothetical protein
LHFHDLRAEFGSRIIDSGSTLIEARDLLRHSDIRQTSTYLRSKSKTLALAIERKEIYEREQERARQQAREKNSHTTGECDNPLRPTLEESDSLEVVKH